MKAFYFKYLFPLGAIMVLGVILYDLGKKILPLILPFSTPTVFMLCGAGLLIGGLIIKALEDSD